MHPPTASIVLPTLEGSKDLRRLLPRLAEQDLPGGFELLAVDSSSSDDSVELLQAAGADVVRIDRADFSHGGTRNRRANDARGEFLVFLSQDALPVGPEFLSELLAPFSDPSVAGSFARVLPHGDDDLLTARTVLDLPEAQQAPRTWGLDGRGLWELEPEERVDRIRFNNVASAIRRSVFERVPFPEIGFGEDFAWAALALTEGHRLAFAPRAVALHAHRYGVLEVYSRYRTDALFHRLSHGWRMRPSLTSAARGVAYEILADLRFARRRGLLRSMPDLARSPLLRLAQVAGQYVGSRALGEGPRPVLCPAPPRVSVAP
jgi:rhamnosyltransferase